MEKSRDENNNIFDANLECLLIDAENRFSTLLYADSKRKSKIVIEYFSNNLPNKKIESVHFLASTFNILILNKIDPYLIIALVKDNFDILTSWHADPSIISDLNMQKEIIIEEKTNDGENRGYNVPLLKTIYDVDQKENLINIKGPFSENCKKYTYRTYGLIEKI